MLLSLVFPFLLTLSSTIAIGPTLKDIVKIKCTQQHPYICLPYGYCCGGDEFCHQGECMSCFPTDIPEADLLTWCREVGQHNMMLMRDTTSCRLACHFRFNASEMQTCQDQADASCPKQCPAGHCCQEHQFCSGDQCQSCFPDNLSDYDLASWCRQAVNGNNFFWQHPSCKYACYSRFTPAQLSAINDTMSVHWIVVFSILSAFVAVLLCTNAIRPIKKQVFQVLSKLHCRRTPENKPNIAFVQVPETEVLVPDVKVPIPYKEEITYNKKLVHSLSLEEKHPES